MLPVRLSLIFRLPVFGLPLEVFCHIYGFKREAQLFFKLTAMSLKLDIIFFGTTLALDEGQRV